MKCVVFVAALLVLSHQTAIAKESQASLDGIIVRAGTNEPLAGAYVSLSLVAPAPSVSPVTTDLDGRFLFNNLAPGLYRLQVYRDGFARQTYGQRTWAGPGTAIRLAAGQSMKNIVMALTPAGNISGVIRDANGQPQTGVPVQLLRAAFDSNGQRTFETAGSATTNDRGEYRLYWITPGRYYISGGMTPGPNRPLNPNAAAPNEAPGRSYTLTYYPGVADGRGAGVIDVNAGSELNGIDFSVPRQRLLRVRGRIIDSTTGQPPPAASVSLAYRTLSGNSGGFNGGARYDAVTGEFELRNVPPGFYIVQAIASDPAAPSQNATLLRVTPTTPPNARVPIEVSNADVNGILLTLSAGATLTGVIRFEGPAPATGWDRVRVQLRPTINSAFSPDVRPAAPSSEAPGPDGGFTIKGVSPGEYVLGPITGLPAGVYVREARFKQTEVFGQPFRVAAADPGALEIVLSSRVSRLDGFVGNAQSRPAAGAQVVLVPETQRHRTDLYKTTTTDANGVFRFQSVPPGNYRVFAWEALDSYAYFDQDLLRRSEPGSAAVQVTESVGNNVTLRVIPSGL